MPGPGRGSNLVLNSRRRKRTTRHPPIAMEEAPPVRRGSLELWEVKVSKDAAFR